MNSVEAVAHPVFDRLRALVQEREEAYANRHAALEQGQEAFHEAHERVLVTELKLCIEAWDLFGKREDPDAAP